MLKQKQASHRLSVAVALVLLVTTLVLEYRVGLSADESYFGSSQWHYLAWIMPILFLLSLVWAGLEHARSKNLNGPVSSSQDAC